jgi:hypothetical protein
VDGIYNFGSDILQNEMVKARKLRMKDDGKDDEKE